MNRRLQLAVIICAAVLASAAGSHVVVRWLGIETKAGQPWAIGSPGNNRRAFMAGSSLAGDGISWGRLSKELDLRIEGWGIAGSSPWEWEPFQVRATPAEQTLLVVSAYDLNEQFLCDFHAEVVPLMQTASDLWECGSDLHFSRRILKLYPLSYLRALFPTAARAWGVLGGLREELLKMLRISGRVESESGPNLAVGESTSAQNYKSNRISDWTPGKTLRRVASMQEACQGEHAYDGPRKLALQRMLLRAAQRGRVFLIVLPVSPTYMKAFLTPAIGIRFEKALADLQRGAPQTHLVRLDQSEALLSDAYFWDLVHMNSNGQQLATEMLLNQMGGHHPLANIPGISGSH